MISMNPLPFLEIFLKISSDKAKKESLSFFLTETCLLLLFKVEY